MSGEAAQARADFGLGPYLLHAAAWSLGLGLVFLATPLGGWIFAGAEAHLVALLLSAAGQPSEAAGAAVQVTGLPDRLVAVEWTAAPAFLLGAGPVLAWPASRRQKLGGLVLLLLNTVLVSATVLAWVAQTPDSYLAEFTDALRGVYPGAMGLVVAVTILYWAARVVGKGAAADG